MPKQEGQKTKLLALLHIFEQKTDENHLLNVPQLVQLLENQGILAERKSIYSDLEALQSFGLDLIRVRDGNITCWYIGERVFQLPELRLLADSVQSSRFITRKKSLELIAKLEGLTSVHQAKELRRQVVVKNRIKAMNESIYYLVDELHTAINGDKRIRFHYTGYDGHGRRVLRRGGAWYDVSPYALLWDDENYYMIGYDSESGLVKHYRVDKMTDIGLIDEERDGAEHFKNFDMAIYSKKTFGMYGGKDETVTLRCKNSLAGVVIDRFGSDVPIIIDGDGYFKVNVKVQISPLFISWVMNFGEDITVLSPDYVKHELVNTANKILSMYK